LKAVEAARSATEGSAPSPGGGPNAVRGPLSADPGKIILPNPPADAQPPPVGAADPVAEEAKRRASEARANEARRPQPAARKAEPFRTGASP
jgi:hypothetical protein